MSDARSRVTSSLAAFPARTRLLLAGAYTPSGLLFASVIALDMLLIFVAMIFGQYLGLDVVTSLTQFPADDFACSPETEGLGIHCFGDYAVVQKLSMFEDPWARHLGVSFNYSAGAILPSLPFTAIGALFGSVRLGLFLYMAALLIALAVPAWWASAGKPVGVRLVTIAAFGVLSVPAIMVLDRGNSVGFLAPILLAYFVALARGNDRMAVISIVLATLVKPQFIILGVMFIVLRRWKLGFVSLGAILGANVLAYLFWPVHFPATIIQSVKNLFVYGGGVSLYGEFPANVSFAESFHQLELGMRTLVGASTGATWADGHQNLIGVVVVVGVAAWLVVLGKRVPPAIGAILLAACASMLPGVSWSYYLVFVLPVAAVLLRDPIGSPPERGLWRGHLDHWGTPSSVRGLAALVIVVAAALTTSRIVLSTTIPGPGNEGLVKTVSEMLPAVWGLAMLMTLLALTIRPERALPTPETQGTR